MAKKVTKKAALNITAHLDRLANLVHHEASALGIDSELASRFIHACDCVSDAVDKKAGIVRKADFDPAGIGGEVSGPLENGAVTPAPLKGEFTQQENRELREKLQSGNVSPKGSPSPASPHPGARLASDYMNFVKLAASGKVSKAARDRVDQAIKLAAVVVKNAAEESEEEEEGEESDKAASHGFDLYA